jgi:hypothetical protein
MLGMSAFFHSAQVKSLTREALAHVWVQKRIPLPLFLRGLGGLRGSFLLKIIGQKPPTCLELTPTSNCTQ